MPNNAVALKDGRLEEVRVPVLFALRKISGTWTEVKSSPAVDHVSNRDVVFNETGWYELTSRELEFFTPGDTTKLPKKNKTAWVTGPWP